MTPAVRALIIATVIAYFLQQTLSGLMDWFVFVPSEVLRRPWSMVTYMFLHDQRDIWHILFNMLGLFFFGVRVEERIGTRRFTWLYFISGIAGAILSFLFSFNSPVIGASGVSWFMPLTSASRSLAMTKSAPFALKASTGPGAFLPTARRRTRRHDRPVRSGFCSEPDRANSLRMIDWSSTNQEWSWPVVRRCVSWPSVSAPG